MPKAVKYILAWSAVHLAYELRTQEGQVILRMQQEPSAWFSWLQEGISFAFTGRAPSPVCLLRQERKQRGAAYWYAYSRSRKTLRKKYVGKSAALTLARLEDIAQLLYAGQSHLASRQARPAQPKRAPVLAAPSSALTPPAAAAALSSPPPIAPGPSDAPLRTTKLHVPGVRRQLLHRPRLTARLQRGH